MLGDFEIDKYTHAEVWVLTGAVGACVARREFHNYFLEARKAKWYVTEVAWTPYGEALRELNYQRQWVDVCGGPTEAGYQAHYTERTPENASAIWRADMAELRKCEERVGHLARGAMRHETELARARLRA